MISPELLRRYTFFAGFSDQELKWLAMAGKEQDFAEDEVLFPEGEHATHLYFLVAGEVEISIYGDEEGETSVPLCTVPAGEITGWSALIEPRIFTSTVRATVPSRAIVFDGAALEQEMAADMHFGSLLMRRVAQVISRRLKDTRIQLLGLTTLPA